MTVVGLTSVGVSPTAPTAHPGGRNLHTIADYILDNCGVSGDALVDVAEAGDLRIEASSAGLAGATIAVACQAAKARPALA